MNTEQRKVLGVAYAYRDACRAYECARLAQDAAKSRYDEGVERYYAKIDMPFPRREESVWRSAAYDCGLKYEEMKAVGKLLKNEAGKLEGNPE